MNNPFAYRPMRGFGGFTNPFDGSDDGSSSPPLSPEEEKSILQWMGGGMLSGVETLGNALDTVGGMSRNAIIAASEGADADTIFQRAVAPLSDPLGGSNRKTGRELLTALFGTSVNDPDKWEWMDFGGGLAEIATDPLSWTGYGALTKAGIQGTKAGAKLAPTVAKGIRAGERSLLSLRVPLLGTEIANTGKFLPQAAGLMEKLDNWGPTGWAKSAAGALYKPMRPLFEQDTLGVTSDFLVDPMRRGSQAARDLVAEKQAPLLMMLREAADYGLADDTLDATTQMYKLLEQGVHPTLFTLPANKTQADAADFFNRLRSYVLNADKDIIGDSVASGRRVAELQDLSGLPHIPRAILDRPTGKGVGFDAMVRELQTTDPAMRGRQFRDWEGGTNTVIDLLVQNAGGDPDAIAKSIMQMAQTGTGPRYLGQNLNEQAKLLGRFASVITPEIAQAGVYANPLSALHRNMRNAYTSNAVADALREGLVDHLASGAKFKPSGDTIGSVFSSARHLGNDWLDKVAADLSAKTGQAINAQTLSQMPIDATAAADMARLVGQFSAPEAVEKLGGWFDSLMALTKATQTGMDPSFHARNLSGGLMQNMLRGLIGLGDMGYYAKQNALQQGKTVTGAAQIPAVQSVLQAAGLPLTDEFGTQALRALQVSHDVIGTSPFTDTASQFASNLSTRGLAGSVRDNFPTRGQVAKAFIPTSQESISPWRVRGVGGLESSDFFLAKAGEMIGANTESWLRGAPFIKLLEQGYSPGVAAKMIQEAHAGYSHKLFTPFERAWMTRIFPYYKFMKGMAKSTANELMSNPGGRTANMIKQQANWAGEPLEAPDHVRETMGLDLGEIKDGHHRYITGFGLPHEDPMSLVAGGVSTNTLAEVLSRMNPVAKGVIEAATGRSLFQRGREGGRDLEDMDPVLGRIMSNVIGAMEPQGALEAAAPGGTPPVGDKSGAFRLLDHILMNSPLGKPLTKIKTLTDPRKRMEGSILPGWASLANAFSPLRVTDVSPAAVDAMQKERTAEIMKSLGARTFVRPYVPKEELATMSSEQIDRLSELSRVTDALVARSKRRALLREWERLSGN